MKSYSINSEIITGGIVKNISIIIVFELVFRKDFLVYLYLV